MTRNLGLKGIENRNCESLLARIAGHDSQSTYLGPKNPKLQVMDP